MSRSGILLLVASALAAVAACGGAEVTDLFGGPGAGDAGTGPGDLDSASSDDGAPPGSDGSVTREDGGVRDGGTTQGDAFVALDSAGKSDALVKLDPGISCGGSAAGETNCATALQYCCATPNGGSSVTFECKANTVSACAGLKIVCDDSADCPGNQFCCGTYEQNMGYTKVDCRGSAACGTTTATTSFVRFCDPTAATDECIGVGKTCGQQSGSLPGYYYCK